MQETIYHYLCKKVELRPDQMRVIPWDEMEEVVLVETASGASARMSTTAKACWTEANVCFLFRCQDDYIVANYTNRDDPIYNEDVVEIFIDEAGDGRRYIELELSPKLVVFDAVIENDLAGHIKLDIAWNIDDLITSVYRIEDAMYPFEYEIMIPHHAFSNAISAGKQWRVNLYRIDEQNDGTKEYLAWSPTKAIDFHKPEYFGFMTFVE
ncbi:carbohydrate-binding family 9-like protein [Paenibacillus sp. GCM10027629]|uniref:carbohydrate-binding family 9-like protein n=1 Tax=Paenibacillus sp. GCM10027629 TaxID=3273414 RepID=UPI00363DA2EC